MAKVTPWFPGSVKPVRAGVYERRYSGNAIAYSRWDGTQWLHGSYEFDLARRAKYPTFQPSLPWRGLAAKP